MWLTEGQTEIGSEQIPKSQIEALWRTYGKVLEFIKGQQLGGIAAEMTRNAQP